MIDKSIDTPPTVEKLYQEGYLTEHVKTTKEKNMLFLMNKLQVILGSL